MTQFTDRDNGKCAICRTPVRQQERVVSYDTLGRERSYERLCIRCFEAEKAYSRTVFVFNGEMVSQIYTNTNPPVARSDEAAVA